MSTTRRAWLSRIARAGGVALVGLSQAEEPEPTAACAYRLSPETPPNDGILFIDHSKAGRSGHLGHALVEYAPGKILAFYPNCSDDNRGHSAVGWMEYKRSEDGGKTWGEQDILTYTKTLLASKLSAFAEKAVLSDQGDIVVFLLVCDISTDTVWSHFQKPTYVISSDQGRTWSAPVELGDKRGRVYDARYYDGEIFALKFANGNDINFLGNKQEHVYELYVSRDGGRTFARRSVLPFDTMGRSYGTIGMLDSGKLIVYIYNRNAERESDYVLSDDGGRTWSEPRTAHFAKKIRNPQLISMDGCYFLHGRSGSLGEERGHVVLYSSRDGLSWDEGVYLRRRQAGLGAYSNSIVVGSKDPDAPKRLLIQASHAYELNKTNVLHWWLTVPSR